MRIMKLLVAAAIATGAMNLATAPAEARLTGPVPQDRHDDARRGEDHRDHRNWRDDRRDRRDWRSDRRHHGWRDNRGRHRGWTNRRVCRTVWRHGHRERVCRRVRRG